ncbi:PucR family transcriptional regulator [Citricoccus sp.]|uniref:PucR family transcriptional regulator n=1 Tax=Citricoccus sp. TaxID=1978372 RepID=UPI002C21D76A|nr:PucR family transcriptional regulator [Citricoccus sp.]HRO92347.1 PucR family transcriptional regulator [Citricoccus sp.]
MITVEKVLRLGELGLETLVEGVMNRAVAWVATTELTDPTPYLSGGEIVLFTGITSPTDGPSWSSYVRRLDDRGVVALGMGVGQRLTWPEVPEDLIEAARGTGLTLFAVPEKTTFLQVIRAVAELRAAEERAALETSLAHQRALTRAATAVDGSTQVLRTLATLLPGAWAAVCTADGDVQERSAPAIPPLPTDRPLAQLIGRLRDGGLRGALRETGPDGTVVIHPLGVHGDPQGYLVVVLPHPLDQAQSGTISTTVALLSLHAERTAERQLSRRRIRAGAVALLLGGDLRAGDALLSVAGDEGWGRGARGIRVCVLRGAPELIREAGRRIEGHTDRTGHRMLMGTPVPRDDSEEEAPVLVEDTPEDLSVLHQVVATAGLRAGIGGSVTVDAAATSHTQALHVLERTAAQHRVGSWDDLAAGGIAGLLPAEAARAWARELLDPLTAQGPTGQRLLETLRVFLAHNGNRRQAAEELGVHRNTLLHQLQSAERALQRSLEDPQLRADLWIALHVTEGPGLRSRPGPGRPA